MSYYCVPYCTVFECLGEGGHYHFASTENLGALPIWLLDVIKRTIMCKKISLNIRSAPLKYLIDFNTLFDVPRPRLSYCTQDVVPLNYRLIIL